jgi:hypothetical protein
MKYLVLIYGDEKAASKMTEADMQKEMAAYGEYTAKLAAAKATSGGAALHPTHTATTVRVRGGKIATSDGPFAETKEQLGGYYIVDAANLDEAVKWAAQCPGAKAGCCEVRPIVIISDAAGKVEFLQ